MLNKAVTKRKVKTGKGRAHVGHSNLPTGAKREEEEEEEEKRQRERCKSRYFFIPPINFKVIKCQYVTNYK